MQPTKPTYPRKRRNHLGMAHGLVILSLAVLLTAIIVYISVWSTVQMQERLKYVHAVNDMQVARAGFHSVRPSYNAESHSQMRALALAIQQSINESRNPAASGREGINKYQERQLNGLPEFTMPEAKIVFGKEMTLSRIDSDDLGPNLEPPGSEEYLAVEYMRSKAQQTSSAAFLTTTLATIKPVSEYGLAHDDRLSDWVYAVKARVTVVSEVRFRGADTFVEAGTPTLSWRQQYGDIEPTWVSVIAPPLNIPVPDDRRCLVAGSQYIERQCGQDHHLVFVEDLVADDGQRIPRCECQSDVQSPPSVPVPARGRLTYVPKTALMEGPGQWKFAPGFKFEQAKDIPATPGYHPVHDYRGPINHQRGRYSGRIDIEFWVRFAKPVMSADDGPENQTPLDLDVCADVGCLPSPGGCVSAQESHWEDASGNIPTNPADGVNLVTTVTTTCAGFSSNPAVIDPNGPWDEIIREQTKYLNDNWGALTGGGIGTGENRRRAGNNGSGQPMGTIPAALPARDTTAVPSWSSVFQPAPQSQTGIDPARMRTFADLQMHWEPYIEQSPRYLRIAR